jgi:S-formylglutathione hydrolase FrmB
VLVDGGAASYYHDRASGPWGTYVVKEAIPAAVARLDADPDRVAIGGESTGGFGALDLARLWPGRFCAVGAHSAALWRTGGETPAGAFDDAEDFARHDLFGAVDSTASLYGYTPMWFDVGSIDPFRTADTSLAQLITSKGGNVVLHVWPGSHGDAYWRSHMEAYIAFYADALARCR